MKPLKPIKAKTLKMLNDDDTQWYNLPPSKIFNAKFNNGAWAGACNGHWKSAEFMDKPYISSDDKQITATVTGKTVKHGACIYQHTHESCRFSFGDNGAVQIEFDYEITGDTDTNWFSFWLDPNNGGWVSTAEVDMLENMKPSKTSINFAGHGHQVPFKQ